MMKTSSQAPLLARIWRAVIKAFTPTRPPDLTKGFGEADTTLFGPMPDPDGEVEKSKSETWRQSGESSLFADSEVHGKGRKRH